MKQHEWKWKEINMHAEPAEADTVKKHEWIWLKDKQKQCTQTQMKKW